MKQTSSKYVVVGLLVAILLGAGSTAQAQSSTPADSAAYYYPWSLDFAFGMDNSISGNINSSGLGTINNQSVVILKNTYEDVYGTGLHFRFGGGYMLDHNTEVRVTFTLQSLDADLAPMGDIGVSKLYGQYDDYQSFGMDFGFRQYTDMTAKVRAYGEGTVGVAFIDETDVVLVAPTANLVGNATDFYDRTAAFTLGGNAGAIFQLAEHFGIYGQMGVRYVTGMSEVDGLVGTGLETINDKSARWTFPVLLGVQARF